MYNKNHYACGMKISKMVLNQEDSIRFNMIIAYLFQIKLYVLHMCMIVLFGLARRMILRRLLGHYKIITVNIIGAFQREEVFHNF